MSYESFDIKFSSVACVLFELRHLPSQNISKTPPGMKNPIFFKKIFAMGFCADLHPVNRINQEFTKKKCKNGTR